ncbi:MAG: hypothetical protein ACM3VZ_11360 [Acidobacteriota bacterium]
MSAGFFNNLYDYGMGGILRKPIKQATGMSDAQLAGAAALAIAAPYALPAIGASGPAAAAPVAGETGLTLGSTVPADVFGSTAAAPTSQSGLLSQFSTYAKPVSQGLGIANQVSQMNQGHPVQAGQLPQRQGPDFSGLLSAQGQQQQAMSQDQMLRKQQQQQVVQGLLNGGAYGRVA